MRISNRKRVLITGGAGFLGSHLCERLLNDGCDVLCVDNFYSGTRDNVAHLLANPHFELMRHDVTFPLYVKWMKYIILLVTHPQFTTSEIPSKQPKPVCMVPSIC